MPSNCCGGGQNQFHADGSPNIQTRLEQALLLNSRGNDMNPTLSFLMFDGQIVRESLPRMQEHKVINWPEQSHVKG